MNVVVLFLTFIYLFNYLFLQITLLQEIHSVTNRITGKHFIKVLSIEKMIWHLPVPIATKIWKISKIEVIPAA